MSSSLGATVVVLILVGLTGAQYEDCATNKLTLLKALYETGDNLYELDRVFFPLRAETTRYVTVNYTFLDNSSSSSGYNDADVTNCSVSYVWTSGGFFLEQHPNILQYTSLLFLVPVNDIWSLKLTLPHPCRALVQNNDTCTCKEDQKTSRALGRITQQVLLLNSILPPPPQCTAPTLLSHHIPPSPHTASCPPHPPNFLFFYFLFLAICIVTIVPYSPPPPPPPETLMWVQCLLTKSYHIIPLMAQSMS